MLFRYLLSSIVVCCYHSPVQAPLPSTTYLMFCFPPVQMRWLLSVSNLQPSSLQVNIFKGEEGQALGLCLQFLSYAKSHLNITDCSHFSAEGRQFQFPLSLTCHTVFQRSQLLHFNTVSHNYDLEVQLYPHCYLQRLHLTPSFWFSWRSMALIKNYDIKQTPHFGWWPYCASDFLWLTAAVIVIAHMVPVVCSNTIKRGDFYLSHSLTTSSTLLNVGAQ